MYAQIYALIWEISNYDWKFLISHFQYHKIYNNLESPTRENVIKFFRNQTWWNNLTEKKQNTIYHELKNILSYFQKTHGLDRNFFRVGIQKKISDYNIEISKLKTKAFDYRKRLASLDPTNDITTFEIWTQQYADTQNKIKFLVQEVKNFKKLI